MPDWLALFPPPWNQGHTELQGFYPYRLRKIYLPQRCQSENWPEAVIDDMKRSSFCSTDVEAGLAFDRAKGSGSRLHISEDSASVTRNEARSAGHNLVVRKLPTPAKPKLDLASKSFSIHSDSFTKHLGPWTIGSYQSEAENLPNKTVWSNLMVKSTAGWTEEIPSIWKPFLSTETHWQDGGVSDPQLIDPSSHFSPFRKYDQASNLGVRPTDGGDGSPPMSDSDSPSWIDLAKKESESRRLSQTGATEGLYDFGSSQKHVSESRKAKKKAYHQRRRQQKATANEIANVENSDRKMG